MKKIILIISLLLISYNLKAQVMKYSRPKDIALMPVQNNFRNMLSLDGIWNFRADSTHQGESGQWMNGLKASQHIAVPGSWNEQIEGLRNYFGSAWYETSCTIPSSWRHETVVLRVGSAVYAAKVWVNGKPVGCHEGGCLPFALNITPFVNWGEENRITIEVENELAQWRVPSGGGKESATRSFPKTNFDYFPYSGINRSVCLYTKPQSSCIDDLTVTTDFKGSTGYMKIDVNKMGPAEEVIIDVIDGDKTVVKKTVKADGNHVVENIKINNVKLWSPQDPHLYKVSVRLKSGKEVVDEYSLNTGVRTIKVDGDHLLLNGEVLRLRGFGKHEDFPIFGRGTALPVVVRDFELMKWVGANSFRTSHYPYDENYYDLADKEGFIIIDEAPGVGLNFYDEYVDKRQIQLKKTIEEMIFRDKNHPSVCFWNVCNEPTPKNQKQQLEGADNKQGLIEDSIAIGHLKELVGTVKQLDASRPVSYSVAMGTPSSWMKPADVVFLNRYFGWYTHLGELSGGLSLLEREMEQLHATYHKPIVYTEFGADCIAGFHSTDDEAFSEEFQSKFINSYLNIASRHDYVAGMLMWCFADFRTGQSIVRVKGQNLKGAFTMDRRPKASALLLRSRWANKNWQLNY